MEIVIIEKTAFETLIAGVKALEDRVRTLAEKGGDRRLAEWMDTEDTCRMLRVTPKTLQALRHRVLANRAQVLLQAGGRGTAPACPRGGTAARLTLEYLLCH